MASVFKRTDYNDIIRQVNALAVAPESGCQPAPTLDEAEPDHIIKSGDIQRIRDVLTVICARNTFPTELKILKKSITDEIDAAIARGWCNCDECSENSGPTQWTTRGSYGTSAVGATIGDECVGYPPGYTPRPLIRGTDLMPDGTQITSAGIVGRYWFLASTVTLWNGTKEPAGGPGGWISGMGRAYGAGDEKRFYGAYAGAVGMYICNYGEFEYVSTEPSETKLEYFLYISGGDGCCGEQGQPPCT